MRPGTPAGSRARVCANAKGAFLVRLLYIRQQRHEVRLSSLITALVAAMAQHGEMRVQLLPNDETEDSLRSASDTAYQRAPYSLDSNSTLIRRALAELQREPD
jgi:hypothetical protein